MIELSLGEFVFAALAGAMALVGCFTLISRVSRCGVERRAVRSRIICRLCLHPFEDRDFHGTPECPSCGALNERGVRNGRL